MQVLKQGESIRLFGKLFLSGLLLQCVAALPSPAQDQADSRLERAVDRAQTAQRSDRFAEAAAGYAEAVKLNPNVAELWANRGLMEHLAGHPSDAVESFKHALALKSSLYTAVLFTGIDYVALDQPEQALAYLKRAASMKPQNPDVYVSRAKAFLALHDPGNAALNYQQATLLRPQDSTAWYGLGVASLGLIDQNGGALAKRYPRSSWALALYGDEMFVQGRIGEASDAYRLAVASSSPQEREIFAALLWHDKSSPEGTRSSSPTGSIDTLLAVIQEDPQSYFSLCANQLAKQAAGAPLSGSTKQEIACLYLTNDISGSASAAAEHSHADPTDPETLYWLVKTNHARAVESFAQFQRLSPESAAAYDLIGDLYRRRMEPDRALAQYSRALSLNARDPAALLGSAAAYLSIGDMERSLAAANLGLSDAAGSPILNLLAAESLVNLRRYDEAAPYLARCIEATKEKNAERRIVELAPRAHALMGRVKAANSDVPGAIAEMRLGLASDQDGSLHFQLSRLYRQQGDLSDAKAAETQSKVLAAERRANAVTAVESPKTALNLTF